MQSFTLGSSKMEVFKTCFFDMVTIQNDHPCYVKQVFGRIWVFFTLFGYWVGGGEGAPKGLVHNLLMQVFTLDSSKIEVFKTCFFDIGTTHYDEPGYLKHVLGRVYMFFILFGYPVGGGSPKPLVHNLVGSQQINVLLYIYMWTMHLTVGALVLGTRCSVRRPCDSGHVIGHAWPW